MIIVNLFRFELCPNIIAQNPDFVIRLILEKSGGVKVKCRFK